MLAVVAVVGFYFAGYGALRMHCSGSGTCIIVPTSFVGNKKAKLMVALYKPLFNAERRLTGHYFYKEVNWGRTKFSSL